MSISMGLFSARLLTLGICFAVCGFLVCGCGSEPVAAAAHFRRALKSNPDYEPAHENLARIEGRVPPRQHP
jgi:hypothetical protein